MSAINGNCENLLTTTLSEVRKIAEKVAEVDTDLKHVKKDVESNKEVISKIDTLNTSISSINTSVLLIEKGVKTSEKTMEKIQESQKDQGERMGGLEKEISDVRLQVAKLKVREAVVWTIMGLVLTGVIGFIFTFLTRLLPPYYYGYGG